MRAKEIVLGSIRRTRAPAIRPGGTLDHGGRAQVDAPRLLTELQFDESADRSHHPCSVAKRIARAGHGVSVKAGRRERDGRQRHVLDPPQASVLRA